MYHYEGEVTLSYGIWRASGQGKLTCYAWNDSPGPEDAFSWRYEGQFNDKGRATGHGTTTYGEQFDIPDLRGRVYSGAHENEEAHGHGTWHYPDGAEAYDGDNQGGEYHGHGTSYRRDGTKEYDGQWEENCWKGNGTLYRHDGTISRQGEWLSGGSAEYEWQEGEEAFWYEGDWDEDDWMHGWGILYRPDRTSVVREGWWQNGEPVDGPPPGYPIAP